MINMKKKFSLSNTVKYTWQCIKIKIIFKEPAQKSNLFCVWFTKRSGS